MKRNVNLKRLFSLLLIVALCFSSLGMTMAEGSPPEPSPGAAQAGEVTPTDEAMPTDTPTAAPTEETTPTDEVTPTPTVGSPAPTATAPPTPTDETTSTTIPLPTPMPAQTGVLASTLAGFNLMSVNEVFLANGVYYKVLTEVANGNSSNTVEVTDDGQQNRSYAGALTIPATVTYNSVTYAVVSIAGYAFYGGTGITALDLSGAINLTSIGQSVFARCTGITGTLTIPPSVTTIRDGAFYGCANIGSVVLTDGLKTIGSNMFYGCTGITGTLTIPSSVTTIGYGAFSRCTGITGTLTIPSSVTTIGGSAFSGCTNIGSVVLTDGLKTIGSGMFSGCTGITDTLTIPSSVTTIGDSAFYGCTNIGSVVLTGGLETIGSGMFSGCTGIMGTLTIPSSVTTIGGSAFSGCTGITGTLTIPSSVTTIGGSAFFSCTGLTTLNMPNVTSIGYNAFYGCTSLKKAELPNGTVTVEASPAASGSTWLQPTAANKMNIIASAYAAYLFLNWSGAASDIADATAASTTYTLPASSGNVTLIANFVPGQAPVITNTTTALSVEQGAANTLAVTATGVPTPTFTATLQGGATLPTWISINASTGEITASPTAGEPTGDTVITVTASNGIGTDATMDFTITVTPVAVTSITVSPNQTTVQSGNTQQFTANVTVLGSAGTAVNWSVNSTLSSIDANGLLTVGTDENATTLTVTATSTFDNNVYGTATVTVAEIVYHFTSNFGTYTGQAEGLTGIIDVSVSAFTELKVNGQTLHGSNYSINAGSTIITLHPSYLDTLDNETYAVRAVFTDGYAEGSFTVNVQDDTVSVTGVTLDKAELTLAVDKDATLTATVSPSNATNKGVKWSSSDPSVATVDNSGKVTAKKAGTATITVTTDDGGYTAACKVKVTSTDTPSTGDNGNLWLWLALIAASAVGVCVLIWRKRRNERR